MKLKIYVVTYLLFLTIHGIAQNNDSIKAAILETRNSDLDIIAKGRTLFLDKLIKNKDKEAAKSVSDYLQKEYQYTDYLPFPFYEKVLVYFATNDFDNIIAAIKKDTSIVLKTQYDNKFLLSINEIDDEEKIFPHRDGLYQLLMNYVKNEEMIINMNIQESSCNQEEKEILSLIMKELLYPKIGSDITKDTLNMLADKFLHNYKSNDTLRTFVRKNLRWVYKTNKWGWGYGIGYAQGIPSGNLSKYMYTYYPGFNFMIDVLYKKLTFSFDAAWVFGKTQTDFELKNIHISKKEPLNTGYVGALAAYAIHESKKIKLSPYLGFVWSQLASDSSKNTHSSDLNDAKTPLIFNPQIGFKLDCKFYVLPYPYYYSRTTSYMPVYLKYSYSLTQFDKKNPELKGGMHFITLGFGLVLRNKHRQL